jgi:hypothetical protein
MLSVCIFKALTYEKTSYLCMEFRVVQGPDTVMDGPRYLGLTRWLELVDLTVRLLLRSFS